MISIHAPRTGSDLDSAKQDAPQTISIHAPRTGSDGGLGDSQNHGDDFNPRSPHGERRKAPDKVYQQHRYFNPRSPHGERLYHRKAS